MRVSEYEGGGEEKQKPTNKHAIYEMENAFVFISNAAHRVNKLSKVSSWFFDSLLLWAKRFILMKAKTQQQHHYQHHFEQLGWRW